MHPNVTALEIPTSETVDSEFQQESTDQKRIGRALKHIKKSTRYSEKVKDYCLKYVKSMTGPENVQIAVYYQKS